MFFEFFQVQFLLQIRLYRDETKFAYLESGRKMPVSVNILEIRKSYKKFFLSKL